MDNSSISPREMQSILRRDASMVSNSNHPAQHCIAAEGWHQVNVAHGGAVERRMRGPAEFGLLRMVIPSRRSRIPPQRATRRAVPSDNSKYCIDTACRSVSRFQRQAVSAHISTFILSLALIAFAILLTVKTQLWRRTRCLQFGSMERKT